MRTMRKLAWAFFDRYVKADSNAQRGAALEAIYAVYGRRGALR